MPQREMKPRVKLMMRLFIGLIVVALCYGGYVMFNKGKAVDGSQSTSLFDKIAPKGHQPGSILGGKKNDDCVRIGVVTWGGYAGGQYFNGGFKPSAESRYMKEYGICVEFKLMDDFAASRNAWKNGEVDLMWVTADAFPTETAALAEYEPEFLFQADWSRGGDAIVVRPGIITIMDLKGKKFAVAFGTPSHTFLINLLQASDLDYKDVTIVEVPSAIDAATAFKSGQVDAAVVWSPDDADCVAQVKGSKILSSTKTATFIIADGFFAKKAYKDANKDKLVALYEGWMKGAAEINGSPEAKAKAVDILAAGLKQPKDFIETAINNVRLVTHGDNLNFFGLNHAYNGVKGEDLYTKMGTLYRTVAVINNSPTPWRQVSTTDIITSTKLEPVGAQMAEGGQTFTAPTKAMETVAAVASKTIRVAFATNSFALDENAKWILRSGVLETAKQFGGARFRIEGHTDNVGNAAANRTLSEKRAASVANFLAAEGGMDKNKFVVVGKGPDEPVADNGTTEGKAQNRRTEVEILQ